MSKTNKDMAELLKDFQVTVTKKLRDGQTTQGFDGTLKIRLDRVFVGKKDGHRALKQLGLISSRHEK